MQLVKPQDLVKASPVIQYLGGVYLANILMHLLPLFLLWKGILYLLVKNPQYRYLIGPVSISNTYSGKSKELIIRYIMANYYDYERAAHVRLRKRLKLRQMIFI